MTSPDEKLQSLIEQFKKIYNSEEFLEAFKILRADQKEALYKHALGKIDKALKTAGRTAFYCPPEKNRLSWCKVPKEGDVVVFGRYDANNDGLFGFPLKIAAAYHGFQFNWQLAGDGAYMFDADPKHVQHAQTILNAVQEIDAPSAGR